MLKSIQRPKWLRNDSGYVCKSCLQKATQIQESESTAVRQTRWLSINQAKRIVEAEKDWRERAEAIRSGSKKSFLKTLEERGLVNQVVGPQNDLEALLVGRRVGAYVGIDPTAPSMHMGHMVPFMALAWFYIHGYPATFLLGGGTARVGDPTDRLMARKEMSRVDRISNITSMHMQLKRLGDNIEAYARRHGYHAEWAWKRALVNNNNWWQSMKFLDFLKGPAMVARMGPLLGRDSVKRRMEQGDGMSFSEFTYPLMQAYDWYKLYETGTQVQIGGADQFGNILEGANIVKKLMQTPNLGPPQPSRTAEPLRWEEKVFGKPLTSDPLGFTVPLMTTSSGEKFGKSAGNAIWLDPDLTSSFDLYQYFLRLQDNDVERFLKLFTFLPLPEITKIMEQHTGHESSRLAQHTLAFEFVYLAHGRQAAELAQTQHKQVFSGNLSPSDLVKSSEPQRPPGEINPSVNKYAWQTNANNNLGARIKLPRSLVEGQQLHKVLWSAGMVASKAEGHRLSLNGGAYIAAKKGSQPKIEGSLTWAPIKDWSPENVKTHLLDDGVIALRIGKWKVKIIEIVSDDEYEELGLTCPGWREDPYMEENPNAEAQEKAKWITARKANSTSSSRIEPVESSHAKKDALSDIEFEGPKRKWEGGLYRK